MSEVWIPLSRLAHGRSGDKGDLVNIGLIAHDPAWLPLLIDAVTPERLAEWFAGWTDGPFRVYPVPGVGGINCILHRILQGGGTVCHRLDAQGKALGQVVLGAMVPVNEKAARKLGVDLS